MNELEQLAQELDEVYEKLETLKAEVVQMQKFVCEKMGVEYGR